MKCKYCHNNLTVDSGCKEVICGNCTQVLLYQASERQKQEEEKYTPEVCRNYRKSMKWSQNDLALQLGIPKHHISNFERGVNPIPPQLLVLLKGRNGN